MKLSSAVGTTTTGRIATCFNNKIAGAVLESANVFLWGGWLYKNEREDYVRGDNGSFGEGENRMNLRKVWRETIGWQSFLWAAVAVGGCSLPTPKPSGKADWMADAAAEIGALSGSSGDFLVLSAESRLADYLDAAEGNNPGLRAAFLDWQAALERIPQDKALSNPKLTYGYFVERVETRTGAQRQRIGLSQALPRLGELRLRGQRAKARAEAAKQRCEEAKQRLFFEVKKAYYELFYLRRAMEVAQETIELLRRLESVAQAGFRAGRDMADVVAAQMELGKLEEKAAELRDLEESVAAKLGAVLNYSAKARLPSPKTFDLSGAAMSDREALEAFAVQNPTLGEWDAQLVAAEKDEALARKAFWPEVSLGVEYVETGRSRFPGVAGTGRDPVMVTGAASLPLWRGKNRAGVREAQARRKSAKLKREEAKNRLLAELRLVLYKLRDAERKIGLFGGTLLPLAQNSLEVAEQAYRAGRSDFMQLIEAQRMLLDVRLSHQRAIADREQRLAEVEMLVGGGFAPSAGGEKSSSIID